MFCMRTSRAVTALMKPSMVARTLKAPVSQSARTFTSITHLRPSVFPSSLSAFRAASPATTIVSSAGATIDILPKISSNPGLVGLQIRCGPRDTYDPSHFVRKRRHGFLSRIRTRKGRALLKRRKAKGRKNLSH